MTITSGVWFEPGDGIRAAFCSVQFGAMLGSAAGETGVSNLRMRNIRVIFDRVTVYLELFVSSKT